MFDFKFFYTESLIFFQSFTFDNPYLGFALKFSAALTASLTQQFKMAKTEPEEIELPNLSISNGEMKETDHHGELEPTDPLLNTEKQQEENSQYCCRGTLIKNKIRCLSSKGQEVIKPDAQNRELDLLYEIKGSSLLWFVLMTILHCSDLVGDFYQGVFLLNTSKNPLFGQVSLGIPFIPGIVAVVVFVKSENLKEQLGNKCYVFLLGMFHETLYVEIDFIENF